MKVKVCPKCKQPAGLIKKSYPVYIEEAFHFYTKPGYGSDDYFIEDPLISEDSRFKDEYFCIECNHLYKGNDAYFVIKNEMVEKDEH